MTHSGRHIGIFGGSFNPVHRGHIAIAQHIAQNAGLDQVWLMLSPLNPFKVTDRNLASDRDRLNMLHLACAGNKTVVPCDIEMSMPRPNYTVNTLARLTELHPDCRFSLIIGGDNWEAFDRWYHHDEILANHDIIIYPRPTDPPGLYANLPTNVSVISGSPALLDISSTAIRQKIRDRLDVSDLLAREVNNYITLNKLYR